MNWDVSTILGERNVTQLVSITFLGRVLGRGFKYLLVVVLARGLGDATLGTFALGFVLVRFGTAVSNLGFESTMRKYIPIYRSNDEQGKITGLLLAGIGLSAVGGALIAVVVRSGLSRFEVFGGVATKTLTLLLLAIPFLSVAKSLDAATLGYDRTRFSVYIRDFGQEGLGVLFVGVGILSVGTETAAAAGYVLALAGTAVIALLAVRRLGGFNGLGTVAFEARETLSYSVVTTFSTLSQLMILWVDIVVLGVLVSRSLVGQYQAAYQTSALLTFGLAASNSIFPSLASRLYETDQTEQLKDLFSALVKWIGVLTWSAVAYTVVLSNEILFIFGTSFQSATQTLIVLAVAQGVVASVGPAGYLLLMTGNERLELVTQLAIAGLNIVLNLLFIPQFGILGAALATGISITLHNVIRSVIVHRLYAYYPNLSDLAVSILPAAGVAAVALFAERLSQGPFVTLISAGIGAGVVFLPISYVFVLKESDSILLRTI
jgi:O-antigen/teichoic acid export membrane protein